MKLKLLFIGAFLLCVFQLSAQTDFTSIPLDTPENVKAAEKEVLLAANAILAMPTKKATKTILEAQLFILNWMEKCPYTFMLTEPMVNCCKKDDLFGIYLAALAKGQLAYEKDYALNAVKIFIAYVNNPEMDIKKTGAIKKLIKANDAGDLAAYTG